MTVTVLTDSAASLPDEALGHLAIVTVPLRLVVGGLDYPDGVLSPEEVGDRVRVEAITTSAPSPGDFAKAIENNDGGDGAVVITVASTMSTSNASARLAAEYFDDGKVEVVDSGTAAGAQGLVVQAAAAAAASGARVTDVARAARRVAGKVRLVAAVENLEYLARSGRVPASAARAGDALGVRAMFEFCDGEARPRRPVFGMKGALDRVAACIEPAPSPRSRLRAAVLHAQAPGHARRLLDRIEARCPCANVFVAPFSSVMVAHTGPGLVGAAWWWDGVAELAGDTHSR